MTARPSSSIVHAGDPLAIPDPSAAGAPAPGAGAWERSVAAWLFVVVAASFLLVEQGTVTGYDGSSMYAVTRSLVDHGSVVVSDEWNTLPGRGGQPYARYGLGLSLLAAVPYALSRPFAVVAGRGDQISAAAVASTMPIVMAALACALFALARRLGARAGPALLVAIGAIAGTFMLPYGKEFFSEPLATLFVVVAVERMLAGRPGTSGLAAGAAVLTRAQTLLFVPLLLIVAWRPGRERSTAAAVAGLAPGVLLTFGYNVVRFGNPLDFGYQDVGFTTPFLKGLSGLLFEPTKSVLLFAPVVVLLPIALAATWRTQRDSAVLLGGNLAMTLVLTATWFAWHGGWCWGPRLLLPGLVPAIALIGPWISSELRRTTVLLLFGLGALVSLPTLLVSTQAQQLEVASPPPWTHYLATQPLASPSVARQWTLVPVTARYSIAHLYDHVGDGRNDLRTFAIWQLAVARSLGPPGFAAAAGGTVALGAVLFVGVRNLRRSFARPGADGVGAHVASAGIGERTPLPSGGENLEAMEAAENYNAFLVGSVLAYASPGARILDFGAGTGTHARTLRARGADVWCVEPDPSLRARLSADGFRAAASIAALGPASFDAAYTFNVLEHIADDEVALVALHDVLVEGGTLLVFVPAFEILRSRMDAIVGHVRRYRRSELEKRVRRAGFGAVRSRYVDSLGFLAALGYRLVGGRGRLSAVSVRRYDRYVFPVSRVLDAVASRTIGKNVLLEASRA
jgi:SAM-dependent methyltransferase